ncbi:MAG: response regulator [Congregibacter sp.]
MRLLVVEDDARLRVRLAEHFRVAAWIVDEAPDGAQARFLVSEYDFDVAIVDLGLPDITGVALIEEWRSEGRDLPILILTARADWQDKVGGLEAGADDYVTKPFYLEEIEARVNALLRRSGGRTTASASYGALRIDFSARRVFLQAEELSLTAFEYNTLAYLAHRGGDLVSRSELLEHLYDGDTDRDSNVIEVFIGRLRKKLDPDGAFKPIETVRGAGYRFALEPESA